MTRPAAAGQSFVEGMPTNIRRYIAPIHSPLIDIVATGAPMDMAQDEGAIFTSSNGVLCAEPGAGLPAYCVGHATTQQATARGWSATQRGDTADMLTESLIKDPPAHSLVHFSGVHTRGDVAPKLCAAGLQVRQVAVYDQKLLPLSPKAQTALSDAGAVIVPLFSPRTAEQFTKQANRLDRAHIIAFSPAIAECVTSDRPASLTTCDAPNAASMIKAIQEVINTLVRVEGRTAGE
ncbi:MAG: uroporphyrinogen-III synthase [Pseudomonadota bacterium]